MGGKICRTWLGSEATVEQRCRQKRRSKCINPSFHRRSLAQYFHVDAMGRDRPDSDTQMKPIEEITLSLFLGLIISVAGSQTVVQAHAFPVRSDPRVGWTVATPPPKVTIWFDGELEPAFSKI